MDSNKKAVKIKKKITKSPAAKSDIGDRAADWFTNVVGSWRFIIFQTVMLAFWMLVNLYFVFVQWDPYPFILLNLFLSTQAAYTGPIIMMSQNRQAETDREMIQKDYELSANSVKSLESILVIMKKFDSDRKAQLKLLKQIHEEVDNDNESNS